MQPIRYVVCDVFTERALAGNPVAVFTNAAGLSDALMQGLARELNLSESVFVLPRSGEGHARIRIFTPSREVPFAGHPTLGTAFVLGEPMQLTTIRLETGSGVVEVTLEREGSRVVFGWMSQPIPTIARYPSAEALLQALGVGASRLPVEVYDNGIRHVYVVVDDVDRVRNLTPDFASLRALPGDVAANVCAGAGAAWKTRMFAPSHGVLEDPATGSAAGPLAVHLARNGLISFGDTIRIEQGAEIGRPSLLHARAEGTHEQIQRVLVGGAAVIVARGEFRLSRGA